MLKNSLKTNITHIVLTVSLALSFGIPLINFLLLSSYYDRSGEWLQLSNQAKKETYQYNAALIRQLIYSNGKNLARITIQARPIKKNKIELSLTDDKKNIVRSTTAPRFTGNQMIWEFAPLENSINKEYYLGINSADQEGKAVRLSLFSTGDKKSSVEINGQALDGKSLAFFTESRFAGVKEKIQTFHQRTLTYKPPFIQLLFYPVFVTFLILFIITLWLAMKAIILGKDN